MRLSEIKAKAKALGVDSGKLKKADLIRAIQRAEGYPDCYGSRTSGCPYTDCCFVTDCMAEKPQCVCS